MKKVSGLLPRCLLWLSDWHTSLVLERSVRERLKTLPPQRYLVMGYARHGKDTVSGMLEKYYHLKFQSPTKIAAKNIVYPRTKKILGYASYEDCYKDRGNYRETWFTLIQEYNRYNKTKFIELILQNSDIYNGLRCREEFLAAKEKGIFDFTIWVDASNRKPPESDTSCTVKASYADVVVDNNTTKMALRKNLAFIMYTYAYSK